MINKCTKLLALLIIAIMLAACEIIVPKQIQIKEEEVLELYKDMPLKDVMNNVQKKFQKAKDEEIHFYSPNNYRTARTGIQSARAYFRNPEKRTHVLTSLYRADKALDDAFQVKVIVARELDEHVKVRSFLDTLEAKKSHTREYRSLMTSLTSIIERIEQGKETLFQDPDKKKNMEERKKNMMDDLLDFRLRVVKFKYLNHGEQLIAESESYDARNIAPATFSRTIKARDGALKFITENVENLEGVSDVATKFQYEAQRLLHISRAVDYVMKLEKNNYEKYILKQEELLSKIAEALNEPQLKYYSFAAQASKYSSIIKRIIREKQENALKIAELKSGGTTEQNQTNTDTVTAEQNNATDSGDQNAPDKPKGLEIVPIDSGGDPTQLKRSLKILTDQVYQLTIEKNAWEGERATLKAEIKKLKAAQKTKPKAKPKTKKENKAAEKPRETKAEEVKPEGDNKKEASKQTEPEKQKAGDKEQPKPEESKTASEPAKTN